MKGLVKGDHIFVSSCDDKELFLLGAMKVTSLSIAGNGPDHGKPLAVGETLAGPFQKLRLEGLKWRLRFENTKSTKLLRSKSLLWQVKSRRRLTRASSELLLNKLLEEQGHRSQSKQ
jgi:hypothetical protein